MLTAINRISNRSFQCLLGHPSPLERDCSTLPFLEYGHNRRKSLFASFYSSLLDWLSLLQVTHSLIKLVSFHKGIEGMVFLNSLNYSGTAYKKAHSMKWIKIFKLQTYRVIFFYCNFKALTIKGYFLFIKTSQFYFVYLFIQTGLNWPALK